MSRDVKKRKLVAESGMREIFFYQEVDDLGYFWKGDFNVIKNETFY